MSLLDPTVAPRRARMNALSTGVAMERFGDDRRCVTAGCGALLSQYNPSATCGPHRGWQAPPQRRRRR